MVKNTGYPELTLPSLPILPSFSAFFLVPQKIFPYLCQKPKNVTIVLPKPKQQKVRSKYLIRVKITPGKPIYFPTLNKWRLPIWMFPKIVVTPKSSILIGFSIIHHPFRGTPIFGNTHILPFFRNDHPIRQVATNSALFKRCCRQVASEKPGFPGLFVGNFGLRIRFLLVFVGNFTWFVLVISFKDQVFVGVCW